MTIKPALVAAALISTLTTASAQQYTCEPNCHQDWPLHLFESGTLTLTETDDQATAWDLLDVSVHAVSGSTSTMTSISQPGATYPHASLSQPITASAFTSTAVQAVWAGAAGFEYTSGNRTVAVKNLKLDTASGSMFADLYTSEGSFLDQLFLQQGPATHISGLPGQLVGNAQESSSGQYSGLVLAGSYDDTSKTASGAIGIVTRGLGLGGVAPAMLTRLSFADVSYSAAYVDGFFDLSKPLPGIPSIPEPATVALLVAGMTVLAARKAAR